MTDIANNLKSFFQKANKTKAVLGLSGGIDSALTAKLAVMALGAENVTAIIMPNNNLDHSQSVSDALNLVKELGIGYELIAIDDLIEPFDNLPWQASNFAKMNIQARTRSCILYHYANTNDAIVLGTGNKTELALGYFTKYGDGACDCEVIGSLYKTDVWELSKELGLPDAIIQKTPTAELAPGQTDEGEIGMNYQEIDAILKKFEDGKGAESENEIKLLERIQANKHKGALPPVI